MFGFNQSCNEESSKILRHFNWDDGPWIVSGPKGCAPKFLYDYKANVFPQTLYLYRNFGAHPLCIQRQICWMQRIFHLLSSVFNFLQFGNLQWFFKNVCTLLSFKPISYLRLSNERYWIGEAKFWWPHSKILPGSASKNVTNISTWVGGWCGWTGEARSSLKISALMSSFRIYL